MAREELVGDFSGPVDSGPVDPGSGDPVPTHDIGLNKPLKIKIHQIFAGERDSKALLVTSAVKSENVGTAKPYALHAVRRNVRASTFVRFTATDDGTPIAYYSAAALSPTLQVQVRLSPDNFDEERYNKYAELIANAAQLPVFAASGIIGGPAGAVGAKAVIFSVKKAIRVVLGAIDRWADGNEANDFISNYTLNLTSDDGIIATKAGWFLMRDDDAGSELMVSPDGKWDGNAEVVGDEKSLFYVDASDGTLRYKAGGRLVDDLDQPYVLLRISGTETAELEGFEPTAAGAALLEQFITPDKNGVIEDLSEIFAAYNDLMTTRELGDLDKKIKATPAADRAPLLEQREALLKHIQDSAVKDLIPTAPV